MTFSIQHFYYSLLFFFLFFFLFDKLQNFFPSLLCCHLFHSVQVFYLFIFDIFDLSCLLSYLFEQDYAGSDVRMLNKSSSLPTFPGNCKKFPVCSKDILKPRSPFYNLCSGLEMFARLPSLHLTTSQLVISL